jgi:hypothetical protein
LTAFETYTVTAFEYIAASQQIHTLEIYWGKLFVEVVQTVKRAQGLLVVGNKS